MANISMKSALYINQEGKQKSISVEDYNFKVHYGNLFCSNGCNVKVHLRTLKKQGTKSFCTNRNSLNKHSENCMFKNKYNDIYDLDFNEQFNFGEKNKSIFNSLMRTAIYKIRKEKNINEKNSVNNYIEKTTNSEVKDILRYIDANKITKDDLGHEKKVVGIFRPRVFNENEVRYLFFKTDNVSAIYFKNTFFNNSENITLEDFDKLYEILIQNKYNNKIVVYGKISERQNGGFNIIISDISHIVINVLPVKEIIKRNGFKKK